MDHIITFAVTLITITNPLGALAIFAGITADRTEEERNQMAIKTAMTVAVILITVTWLGKYLLDAFGVTPSGLQVAGGVIIALFGLSMLQAKTSEMSHNDEEGDEAQVKESIAVVPMAIPVIAGPGAITTVILATHHFPSFTAKLAISAICIAVSLVIWFCLHYSSAISRKLGVAGMNVMSRLMGMVLAAIAFEMLTDGLKQLLPGLA